jgi:hypothetical protein
MQGLPAYVIDSDALVDAPRESCANLASWLDAIGLSAGTRGWDVDAATAIIEPALTHHPDFGGDSPPSQVAFIEHLRSLSGAHANFDQRDPGPDSPWSSETLALLRKLDLTTDQLAQLGLGNKQLSDEHQDLIATYEDLVAVAGDRLSVIRRLQDIVAATQDDVAELTGRLDRVAAEAADWQRRAERAAVELTEIRTSNSWKATAPLRAAREAVDLNRPLIEPHPAATSSHESTRRASTARAQVGKPWASNSDGPDDGRSTPSADDSSHTSSNMVGLWPTTRALRTPSSISRTYCRTRSGSAPYSDR